MLSHIDEQHTFTMMRAGPPRSVTYLVAVEMEVKVGDFPPLTNSTVMSIGSLVHEMNVQLMKFGHKDERSEALENYVLHICTDADISVQTQAFFDNIPNSVWLLDHFMKVRCRQITDKCNNAFSRRELREVLSSIVREVCYPKVTDAYTET